MPNNISGSYKNPFKFDFSQRSMKQYQESAINVAKNLLGFSQKDDEFLKVTNGSTAQQIEQYEMLNFNIGNALRRAEKPIGNSFDVMG